HAARHHRQAQRRHQRDPGGPRRQDAHGRHGRDAAARLGRRIHDLRRARDREMGEGGQIRRRQARLKAQRMTFRPFDLARWHVAHLWIAVMALALVATAAPALAEKGKLLERLTPDVMAVVYPGAERLGPEEGSPPAIAVYRGDKIVAYLFS